LRSLITYVFQSLPNATEMTLLTLIFDCFERFYYVLDWSVTKAV